MWLEVIEVRLRSRICSLSLMISQWQRAGVALLARRSSKSDQRSGVPTNAKGARDSSVYGRLGAQEEHAKSRMKVRRRDLL